MELKPFIKNSEPHRNQLTNWRINCELNGSQVYYLTKVSDK
jgi:hypothetical protein